MACDAPLKPGTKALINCKDGYTFQPGYSATVLMCQPNGEWDKAATKCIPVMFLNQTFFINGNHINNQNLF